MLSGFLRHGNHVLEQSGRNIQRAEGCCLLLPTTVVTTGYDHIDCSSCGAHQKTIGGVKADLKLVGRQFLSEQCKVLAILHGAKR
jgi:hypothetical protein